MATKDLYESYGVVKQAYANAHFLVELENGHKVLAHICGRIRKHKVKIVPGDRVTIEISGYDLNKGRITVRQKTFPSVAQR